jgi:hypothetical protein
VASVAVWEGRLRGVVALVIRTLPSASGEAPRSRERNCELFATSKAGFFDPGHGIEREEVKVIVSVIVEKLLREGELAIKSLPNVRLIGQRDQRCKNAIGNFTIARKRDIGRVVERRIERKSECLVNFPFFQNSLDSEIAIIRAWFGITKRSFFRGSPGHARLSAE